MNDDRDKNVKIQNEITKPKLTKWFEQKEEKEKGRERIYTKYVMIGI